MKFLREIHLELSHINFDYSTTGDYILASSKTKLEEYHRKYIENVRSLDRVQAAVDMNYPQLSSKVKNIHGQANLYWGHRRTIIIGDQEESGMPEDHWKLPQLELQKACDNIAVLVGDIHKEISNIAETLRQKFGNIQMEEPEYPEPEVMLTSVYKVSWWAVFIGALLGVLLLAPDSNFAHNLRDLFLAFQESIAAFFKVIP